MKVLKWIIIGLIGLSILGYLLPKEDKTKDSTEAGIMTEVSAEQKRIEDSIKSVPILTKDQMDSIAQIEKIEKDKKLTKLRKKCDEFTDACFYYHKSSSKYRNSNDFALYITNVGDSYGLRLTIQYLDDDWLFIRSVKVKADEKIFNLYTAEFERDNDGGKIWEWSDTSVDQNLLNDLEQISNAKSVKIRFEGDKYYNERNLSAEKIKALREVIEIYNFIK